MAVGRALISKSYIKRELSFFVASVLIKEM